MLVVPFLKKHLFCDTLTSNDIRYRVRSEFIISTDQSMMSLVNFLVLRRNTDQELLFFWSIHVFLTTLHICIGLDVEDVWVFDFLGIPLMIIHKSLMRTKLITLLNTFILVRSKRMEYIKEASLIL